MRLSNKGSTFFSGDQKISDLLNQTLNKSDAFSQRMSTSAKSVSFLNTSMANFKRKTTYSKKNEKLWTLLDQFKNQVEEQK